MEYTTSPSDTSSVWDSNTRGTMWNGPDVGSPVTPPMLYAPLPEPPSQSFTSYPREMAASSESSSTSPGSPIVSKGRQCVAPEDWAPYREIITFSYKEQNKSLKEVAEIMRRKYGFDATVRMFKQRLRDWKVGKNVTEPRVCDMYTKFLDAEKEGKNHEVDEEDAERIMKYLKRSKPRDPAKILRRGRLMKYLKPFVVDDAQRRSSRGKMSMSPIKLEKRQSPSSHPAMPWSPGVNMGEVVPDNMTQLVQTFVNEEFHAMPYSYYCSPVPFTPTGLPAPAQQWQPERPNQNPSLGTQMVSSFEATSALDESMLNFTIRLRYANMLFDDGLGDLAMHVMRQCLDTISSCLQQSHKATTIVLLYALSAALEMAVSFDHLTVLHTLFQRISHVCAGQHPAMAEIARRMPQPARDLQIATLKRTRDMIWQESFGYLGSQNPGFELYSRAVDISIGDTPPEVKLNELCALSTSPSVTRSENLTMWLDARMAAAVCDAPLAAQQLGIWTTADEQASVFFHWEHPMQSKKILVALSYIASRVRYHKMANNCAIAARMARDTAMFVEMGWGPDDAVVRKFRDEVEDTKPPVFEQMSPGPVLLPPLHTHAMGTYTQLAPSEMVHGLPSVDTPAGSSAGWIQPTTATTHGQYHQTTLPAFWNAGNNGNPMGHGVDMYGGCF